MEDDRNNNLLNDEALEQVAGGAYTGPCTVYFVRQGDTPSKIAARFQITVEELHMLNIGIRFAVGMGIRVPQR